MMSLLPKRETSRTSDFSWPYVACTTLVLKMLSLSNVYVSACSETVRVEAGHPQWLRQSRTPPHPTTLAPTLVFARDGHGSAASVLLRQRYSLHCWLAL